MQCVQCYRVANATTRILFLINIMQYSATSFCREAYLTYKHTVLQTSHLSAM